MQLLGHCGYPCGKGKLVVDNLYHNYMIISFQNLDNCSKFVCIFYHFRANIRNF